MSETVNTAITEENAMNFMRLALGALRTGEATMVSEHIERVLPKVVGEPEFALLRGRLARVKERFKESRKWLRGILDDPELGHEARYELGRSLLESGRRDMAADVLRRLSADPDLKVHLRVHAFSALAVAFTALERFESAQAAIEEAAKPGIVSAQLLIDEAYRLAALGARAEAVQQLQQAIQIDAGCPDGFFLLANLLYINGQVDDGLQIVGYGLQEVPTHIKLLALAGEIYRSMRKHEESAEAFRAAVSVSPQGANSDSLRLESAKALFASGKTGGAKQALEELLERNPRSSFRREARARLSALDGDKSDHTLIDNFPRGLQKRAYCAPNTLANVLSFWGKETTQDEVATQIFTDGARWHDLVSYLRGVEGFETRAFLGDMATLKRLLDSDIPVIVGEYTGIDGHCIALIGYDDRMGVMIAQDPLFYEPIEITYGEFVKSWAFTDNLMILPLPQKMARTVLPDLNLDTCEVVQRWMRTLSMRQQGQFDIAIGELGNLIDSHPKFLSPLRTLVEIHIMRGDPQAAMDALKPLLEADKLNYWALRYAGDAALSLDQLADAWEYFGRAVRRFSDDPTLHYARGEIALYAGDRKRGRAELMWALDARPAYIPARVRLAKDYLEAGDFERARWHAESVLELSPMHEIAEAILDGAVNGNAKVKRASP